MPSGNRLVTIRKKTSAVATSPRRRHASSRSRYTTQRATASMSAELHDTRGGDSGVLMRSERDHPPLGNALREKLVHKLDASGVERGERFVEQPERHVLAQHEACERCAPPLALRHPPQHRALRNLQARERTADRVGQRTAP